VIDNTVFRQYTAHELPPVYTIYDIGTTRENYRHLLAEFLVSNARPDQQRFTLSEEPQLESYLKEVIPGQISCS
jgi:hypothetical protein